MKESPISALYDALLPSLKQHAPKDKTLELLRYYCDKIYQEGELNGLSLAHYCVEDGSLEEERINNAIRALEESQLERKEQ